MAQQILLDAQILFWVLIPLIVIILLVGVIRHYAAIWMKSKPNVDLRQAKERNVASYGRLLIEQGYNLSPNGFKQRVATLTNPDDGKLKEKVTSNPMMALMDPSMAGNMGKQQILMLLPNIVMMTLMSSFFGGFVIAKFPFPLSHRFKGMVQRGVDIDHLEASYVTSMSLYFLILFGMQGIVKLLVGEDAEGDESQMMQQQMGAMQGQAAGPDVAALYKQTLDDLEFSLDHYKYTMRNAAQQLIGRA